MTSMQQRFNFKVYALAEHALGTLCNLLMRRIVVQLFLMRAAPQSYADSFHWSGCDWRASLELHDPCDNISSLDT